MYHKNIAKTIVCAMAFATTLTGVADTETVNGITWNYTVDKIEREASLRAGTIPVSTVGAVTVPSTLGGCPVKRIGASAFSGCDGLTSVTIPDSVESIGDSAFCGCFGLTSVSIGNGVKSIIASAFSGLTNLTSVTIGTGVKSIGDSAFFGCSGLLSVTIPYGVTSVGASAFKNCSGLMSVTIPDSVTGIGDSAFAGCGGLVGVSVGNRVGNIGWYAFSGCSNLTSVAIPASVTRIGASAFKNCSGLTSLTIPASVKSIGDSAFAGCAGLTSVTIPQCVCAGALSSTFPSAYESIMNVVIADGATGIGDCAFKGCSDLTSITIPASVTSVGVRAFDDCNDALFDIATIPGVILVDGWAVGHTEPLSGTLDLTGIRGIAGGAFEDCDGLTSVTIPSGVTGIGACAFAGCSGLTSITIPASVTSVGAYAFDGCNDALFDIATIPGVMLVDGWAVGHTESLSGDLNLTGVRGIGGRAFEGCSSLTSVTIPANVTSVGEGAFADCDGLRAVGTSDLAAWCQIAFGSCDANPLCYAHDLYLNGALITDLTVPSGVTTIGDFAFSGGTNLTSVTIPFGVTDIGDSAFADCGGLTNVLIYGDSLISVGVRSFASCSSLDRLMIPKSVTWIGDNAFKGVASGSGGSCVTCGGITSVKQRPIILPLKFKGVHEFSDSLFRFSDRVVLPDGIGQGLICEIEDGEAAIVGMAAPDAYGSITIPSSYSGYRITCIEDEAFSECTGLTDVTIGSSVKRIGNYAFEGCSGLTGITIGNGVTNIGAFAFADCSSLKSMTIPSNVEWIGPGVFAGCCGMTRITVPQSWRKVKVYYYLSSDGYIDEDDDGLARYVWSEKGLDLRNHPGLGELSLKSYLFVQRYDSADGYEGEELYGPCYDLKSVDAEDAWLKSIKITYRDVRGRSSGDKVTIPAAWQKARTLCGVAMRALGVQGVFEMKCGKASKQGIAKVSATLTGLDGKRKAYKAVKVDVIGETVTVNLGGLIVTIDGETFEGSDGLAGGLTVQSAKVGGIWSKETATVSVDMSDLSMFAGTVLSDFLPDGEAAAIVRGKWKFAKAASVKWAKPVPGAPTPAIYDAESGKGLVVDTSRGKTNLSGLKLSYMSKKGTFKGSFKVHALEGTGKARRLKKHKVNVNGVVVEGVGYGIAQTVNLKNYAGDGKTFSKRAAVSWTVLVK